MYILEKLISLDNMLCVKLISYILSIASKVISNEKLGFMKNMIIYIVYLMHTTISKMNLYNKYLFNCLILDTKI